MGGNYSRKYGIHFDDKVNFATQNYKLHNPPNHNVYKLKVEWNDDKSPTHMSLNIEGVTIYLWCIDSYEDLQ